MGKPLSPLGQAAAHLSDWPSVMPSCRHVSGPDCASKAEGLSRGTGGSWLGWLGHYSADGHGAVGFPSWRGCCYPGIPLQEALCPGGLRVGTLGAICGRENWDLEIQVTCSGLLSPEVVNIQHLVSPWASHLAPPCRL